MASLLEFTEYKYLELFTKWWYNCDGIRKSNRHMVWHSSSIQLIIYFIKKKIQGYSISRRTLGVRVVDDFFYILVYITACVYIHIMRSFCDTEILTRWIYSILNCWLLAKRNVEWSTMLNNIGRCISGLAKK